TDGDGSHGSTSKTPSYTKSVSWHHYLGLDDYSVNVHFLRLRAADCKFCQLNGKYFCSLYNVKLLR
ncbi:hypothetical protein M8Q10_03135, partial [Enterobacter cloacae]|nr:hypothetical protein [Enterobacter cloacae]